MFAANKLVFFVAFIASVIALPCKEIKVKFLLRQVIQYLRE